LTIIIEVSVEDKSHLKNKDVTSVITSSADDLAGKMDNTGYKDLDRIRD
jgi:hypothetical protein